RAQDGNCAATAAQHLGIGSSEERTDGTKIRRAEVQTTGGGRTIDLTTVGQNQRAGDLPGNGARMAERCSQQPADQQAHARFERTHINSPIWIFGMDGTAATPGTHNAAPPDIADEQKTSTTIKTGQLSRTWGSAHERP